MNEDADNQMKYSKSITHLDKKIPLASDASNLLSDYLDTLCIQFARNNVAEPYSITAEFEEMILAELSELSVGHKLTIDVVVKIIEKIGEPKRVVKNYIKDNNPSLVKIFEDPMVNERRIKGIDRKLNARREGNVKDAIISLLGIITYGFVFMLLLEFAFIAFFGELRVSYYYTYNEINFTSLIFANLIYLLIEIVSAFSGETFIGVKPAKFVRHLFFKLEFLLLSVLYIRLIRVIINEYAIPANITFGVFFAIMIFVIVQIRDYLPFIYPLYSDPKFMENFNVKNVIMITGALIFYSAFLFSYYSSALSTAIIGMGIMGIGLIVQIKNLKWMSWHTFMIFISAYGFLYILTIYPYFQ